jgi:hypothetical protein
MREIIALAEDLVGLKTHRTCYPKSNLPCIITLVVTGLPVVDLELELVWGGTT